MLSAYDSVEEKLLKLFKKIQILFKYLLNRQKAVKIHLRRDLIRDFRFHLRPVLFSVYLNNPFFFLNSVEFCNFVDDARKPLLPMLEKWKRCINNGAHVFVLFMSLSKNFDTINHQFMLAKLKAYVFSTSFKPYAQLLTEQKTGSYKQKITDKLSLERDVIGAVPQGSIDGPLFLNLFINDLVLFIQYTV